MEPFNDREVAAPKHIQANHEHLMASAFGAPPQRRSADTRASSHPVEQPTHPVEPPKPPKPVEPQKPTHPVEPPKPPKPVEPPKPTHPVEPPKPTHPVEPPKPPVEPPRRPPQRDYSPPAEPFRPRVPEKQETKTPPAVEKHTPVPERPTPEKPAVPVNPPEQSKTVPPPEKSHPVPPPEKSVPAAPEKHGKPGEVKITIDHTYKSDEEHRTIQKRVEHVDAKTSAQKHVKDTAHEKVQHKAEEKKEHHVSKKEHHAESTHHSSHGTHHRVRRHHSSGGHHSDNHHQPVHHKPTQHKATHQADTHHADSQHKAVKKAEEHHVDKASKTAHTVHQKDTAHVADKAKVQEKKKDVEVTTVHVDKKHVEEHTRVEMIIKLPEPAVKVEPVKPIEPPKEPVAQPKSEIPVETKTEPKAVPVEPPPVVQSPAAEPTRVEKPAQQTNFKPGDSNELSTSFSRGQVTATVTHEHHVDPKTYYRASVNAGIAGDHVGLGNTSLTVGRHLFNPYDKDGNPARGNLNLEGGLVLKTGHTYDYGKLPRFGDTAAHVGVNGYYQLKDHVTLYGSVDAASNPKQFDAQFGAIKDSGRLSLQLGAEYSKVEGYGGSRFVTPGVSYRLNKNTSIYASGAINMDGHKERNGLWTGFRVGF